MEKSSKRGKIPQQDWPSIITRYEAGETLASIARTYDCSPPAISYIVSRTRARSAAAEATMHNAPSAAEPQLVKAPGPETSVNGIAASESLHGSAIGAEARDSSEPPRESRSVEQPFDPGRHGEPQLFPDQPLSLSATPSQPVVAPRTREPELSSDERNAARHHGQRQPDSSSANGAASHAPGHHPGASGHPGGPPESGENRRRLHLPLTTHLNGGSHAPEPLANVPGAPGYYAGPGSRAAPRPAGWQPGPGRSGSDTTPPTSPAGPRPQTHSGTSGSVAQHREREGGAFIDQALRERVEGDITAFLAAFDAALAGDSPESRTGLREATDRLLRAGARTRIELERLEARAPLAGREKDSQAPLFRR
jgi:hypothetical protein